ncbi:hypothetical protein OH76DRAFT_817934 [Lentinus brumalis]|uniref:Uncharacterized protein n=1 Tax=Lentinus brumalis TaxID=2498619 RepID=A0A371D2N5_9APHY|nr:hypothetical protein OH76DRAFT_817934 [Polyporus brumalis]
MADELASLWRNGRSAVTADATIRWLQSYSDMGNTPTVRCRFVHPSAQYVGNTTSCQAYNSTCRGASHPLDGREYQHPSVSRDWALSAHLRLCGFVLFAFAAFTMDVTRTGIRGLPTDPESAGPTPAQLAKHPGAQDISAASPLPIDGSVFSSRPSDDLHGVHQRQVHSAV